MAREHTPRNESEMLSCLYEFVEIDLDEIKTLPLDDIVDELKREGIDTKKIVGVVRQKIAKVKAQHVLAHAHSQREERLKKLPGEFEVFLKTTGENKQEIIRQIKQACTGSQEEILAYCRKLEGVSVQDLKTVLADLELLDQLNKDDNGNREN